MTNDGDLIDKMMRGANGHEKEYVVRVNREVTDLFLHQMAKGVYLEELKQTTRPCQVERIGKYTFRIVLTQGLNRQIRRMCSAVGLQVVRLRRSAEGPVKLGMLQPGEYRELKKSEINALRNAAMKSAGKGESRAASPARRPGPLKKRTNSD